MTKRDITHIIKEIFRQIKKTQSPIIRNFDQDSIHKFRVQIKKLGALLRLLSFKMDVRSPLKLPKRLKNIYSAAGNVRSIQLQLSQIKNSSKNNGSLTRYNKQLEKDLDGCIKKLKMRFDKKIIQSKEKKIISKIPEKIDDSTFKNFYQLKIKTIKSVIESGVFSDGELHTIRKLIKDLIYISKIVRESGVFLIQNSFLKEENLKFTEKVAQELGEFNDVCSGIRFLTPDYFDENNPDEMKTLDTIRTEWNTKKKVLREALIKSIKSTPIFQVN